jgi:hypothetical protein
MAYLFNFFSFLYKKNDNKKIAIILGINCNNDIKSIIYLLTNKFKYYEKYIYILNKYSKYNLLYLLKNIKCYDNIFIYYSGYINKYGIITEDGNILFNFEINNLFINMLPKNVKLFGLIDTYNNKNCFILPYYYNNNQWYKYNYNFKIKCNICIISICSNEDSIFLLKKNNKIFKLFINIINKYNKITWYKLYNLLKINLKNYKIILTSTSQFNINNNFIL